MKWKTLQISARSFFVIGAGYDWIDVRYDRLTWDMIGREIMMGQALCSIGVGYDRSTRI